VQSPGCDAETTKRWLHVLASQLSFEEFLKHSRSASDTEGVS
jgi:hypothetical protein